MNHAINVQVPTSTAKYYSLFQDEENVELLSPHLTHPSVVNAFVRFGLIWLNKFNERIESTNVVVHVSVRLRERKRAFCTRKLCCHTLCILGWRSNKRNGPKSVVKHLISISGMLSCTNNSNRPTNSLQSSRFRIRPRRIFVALFFRSFNEKKSLTFLFGVSVFFFFLSWCIYFCYECSIWHESDLYIKPCCKAISCVLNTLNDRSQNLKCHIHFHTRSYFCTFWPK